MTRIPINNHLSAEEIARRYRTCPDGAEKTRWQVLCWSPGPISRCLPDGPPKPWA
ncbi:hypothetical protein [Zavarzinella formosa]|uniref:hypothetical protein n=1 Tax=Zavarzinella formosa TaxID=360055 RepID=UPI00031BA8BB|nr:hypothetical protein [Zavarzinella formosa]